MKKEYQTIYASLYKLILCLFLWITTYLERLHLKYYDK